MKWPLPRFLQKSLATIACQFVSIGLLTASVWSTSGPAQRQDQMSPQYRERLRASVKEFEANVKPEDLKVINKTQKFEIVNIEKINAQNFLIQLTLKNGYDKSIMAYAFGVGGAGQRALADLAFSEIDSESHIPPGGTTIVPSGISLSGIHQQQDGSISISREQNLFITIYAVIFDDKIAEGDPKTIAQMLAFRAEQKRLVILKYGLLQKALNSSDLDLDLPAPPPELVDKLKSHLSTLFEEAIRTANKFKEMSETNLHEDFSNWLNNLDNWLRSDDNTSLRNRMLQIKKVQEQILSRV